MPPPRPVLPDPAGLAPGPPPEPKQPTDPTYWSKPYCALLKLLSHRVAGCTEVRGRGGHRGWAGGRGVGGLGRAAGDEEAGPAPGGLAGAAAALRFPALSKNISRASGGLDTFS